MFMAAIVLLAASTPAADLKQFTFKNFSPGWALKSLDGLGECNREKDGGTACYRHDDTVAGRPAHTIMIFYDMRMLTVGIQISRRDLQNLVDAFAEKYGPACSMKKAPWVSAEGVQLTQNVLKWCFKTGQLTIEEYGEDIGHSTAIYVDEETPAPKSRVDF